MVVVNIQGCHSFVINKGVNDKNNCILCDNGLNYESSLEAGKEVNLEE